MVTEATESHQWTCSSACSVTPQAPHADPHSSSNQCALRSKYMLAPIALSPTGNIKSIHPQTALVGLSSSQMPLCTTYVLTLRHLSPFVFTVCFSRQGVGGAYSVGRASLELGFSCLSFQSAGVTGMDYYAWHFHHYYWGHHYMGMQFS